MITDAEVDIANNKITCARSAITIAQAHIIISSSVNEKSEQIPMVPGSYGRLATICLGKC